MESRYQYAPSALLCRQGAHQWTTWGPFTAVDPGPIEPNWRSDTKPLFEPVEAYRWRHCECGAAEREKWHSREREVFLP